MAMLNYWKWIHFNLVTRQWDKAHSYKAPMIRQTAQPDVDYILLDDIETVYSMGEKYFPDYAVWRDIIVQKITAETWANLTDAQKDIVIDLDIVDPSLLPDPNTPKVVYLMGKDHSQSEAVNILTKNFAKRQRCEVNSCIRRADAEEVIKIIGKYLSQAEGKVFFQLIKPLVQDYKEAAVKGTNDGYVGEGMFDFFESTVGTSFEFAGLDDQGFTMLVGDPNDTDPLRDELLNWFRYRYYNG